MQFPKACLGTLAARDGARYPFVSLVAPALGRRNQPLLLLSDLSDHVRNLKEEPKASLLFDGTGGLDEPLTGPRVTLLGEVSVTVEASDRADYLARQPAAALYADFRDFRFYRFAPAEALLVAGFGRIHRLAGADLMAALPGEP